MINATEENAKITLHQKSYDGNTLATHQIDQLEPGHKRLFLPADHFEYTGSFYFDIVADKKIFLMALRGSNDATFLWGNLARDMSLTGEIEP